jgi:predicted nucleic acid-binding protein
LRRSPRASGPGCSAHATDATTLLADRIVHLPGGDRVLSTALECHLSAYDAEFVVAAPSLGLKLVSAAQEILAGAPDVAVPLSG